MTRIPVLKYRERFDEPGLPSLQELVSEWDPEVKAAVIDYLNSEENAWVASTGMALRDEFTGEKVPGLYDDFFLDDEGYCWRADLAYYVDKYDVGLPEGFIAKALAR